MHPLLDILFSMSLKKEQPKDTKVPVVPFQSPKGMHDILPTEQYFWERVRDAVRSVADSYHFTRIDTTLLENERLFEASLGASSDVVERQMFTLRTKGDDALVLRPEGTASVARSYIQHGLSQLPKPLKLYYIGPMFRYEQPQAGRFRQFHQAGFEILGGDDDPIYDAQIILVTCRLMELLKLKKLIVKLNSIGCKTCRPMYRKKLVDFYKNRTAKTSDLCKDCERRLASNPLRLLDCKNPSCIEIRKDAPISLNSICSYCKAHFKGVLEYLDELKLPYTLDHYLVRGLDYYNRTVFEVFLDPEAVRVPGEIVPDVALAGGGRYDYLIPMLGGRDTPAVGAAVGLERLVDVVKTLAGPQTPHLSAQLFLIHIGELAKKKSLSIIETLRRDGIDVAESLGKESLKAQLRVADKSRVPYALIFGQKEALEEAIIIRDLQTGAQETVPLTHIVHELKRRLK